MNKLVQVRGVDAALWQQVIQDAKKRKWTMAAWLEMAIDLMLHFDERAEEYCRTRGRREPK